MTAHAACLSLRRINGQTILCTQPHAHTGPHAGPGEPPIHGAAWCDNPCPGGLCPGPCHPDDPRTTR